MSNSTGMIFHPLGPSGPSFTFRPPRPRERRFLEYEAAAEGVRFHDTEAIRAEAVLALKTRWPADEYSAGVAKLRRMWMKLDGGQKLPRAQATALDELNDHLFRDHPPLWQMAEDNRFFIHAAPRIAASLLLDGWAGIPVPFARAAGRVPMGTLDQLEQALAAISRELAPEQPDGEAFVAMTMSALAHATGATAAAIGRGTGSIKIRTGQSALERE